KRWIVCAKDSSNRICYSDESTGMPDSLNRASASHPVEAAHFELGRRGEALAAAYLEQRGYRVAASNFTLPVGRNMRGAIVNAEIDLVAYEGATLCFVEVKT